ncbi:MAG: GGDEF domain-containing protein [Spirochaetales bacterium]|jgi:diguanylate cyclase (GGDEF)-like protein|nr:GGDEF domain-containing protein [Spirochaetales bacterium]
MEKSSVFPAIDLEAIKKLSLFSLLQDGDLQFVVDHSSLLQLRHGGRLFSENQRAQHIYALMEGTVRVYRLRQGGADELAWFTGGDTIGDFDFARQAVYDARADAVDDSVLLMFPGFGMALEDFIYEAPQAVTRILLCCIIMMSSRITMTHKVTVDNLSWVQELQRRAYEDPGTGLWQQSFLRDEMNRILRQPSALVMLKPDRFKELNDTRGHAAGDEAMVRIAMILKTFTRKTGRGWAVRFKSNETGLFINNCGIEKAGKIARALGKAIRGMKPFPAQEGLPAFNFSATIVWTVWPDDGRKWDSLLEGTAAALLHFWRAGGNTIVHCRRKQNG